LVPFERRSGINAALLKKCVAALRPSRSRVRFSLAKLFTAGSKMFEFGFSTAAAL
jgi:hypothetical protein